MISVSNVSYQYPGGRSLRFPSFDLNSGEHCLLLGESGSGKTTLLHLMGGLLEIQNGSIHINDADIGKMRGPAMDTFRGRNFGFIFQRHHLVPSLNVRQNLLVAQWLAGEKHRDEAADVLLARLGLAEYAAAPIAKLSDGQRQRIAIARAVIHKPRIVLADEPTSALDDTNCHRVVRLLLDTASACNATLVIATHDLRLRREIHRQINLGHAG